MYPSQATNHKLFFLLFFISIKSIKSKHKLCNFHDYTNYVIENFSNEKYKVRAFSTVKCITPKKSVTSTTQ